MPGVEEETGPDRVGRRTARRILRREAPQLRREQGGQVAGFLRRRPDLAAVDMAAARGLVVRTDRLGGIAGAVVQHRIERRQATPPPPARSEEPTSEPQSP